MLQSQCKPIDILWESHKSEIRVRYLVDDWPLDKLMREFKEQNGLTATKRQWISKLKQWGFRKNLDKRSWRYVGYHQRRREKLGKRTAIIVSGVTMLSDKVRKGIANHCFESTLDRISQQRLPSPSLPEGVSLVIYTPPDTPLPHLASWPEDLPGFRFRRQAICGADVNAPAARHSGAAALQLAALSGYLGIVKLPTEEGADSNAPGEWYKGRTALEAAAEHGRLDTVQYLLSSGAQTKGQYRAQYFRAIKFAEKQAHFAVADMLRTCRAWNKIDHQMFDEIICLEDSLGRFPYLVDSTKDRDDDSNESSGGDSNEESENSLHVCRMECEEAGIGGVSYARKIRAGQTQESTEIGDHEKVAAEGGINLEVNSSVSKGNAHSNGAIRGKHGGVTTEAESGMLLRGNPSALDEEAQQLLLAEDAFPYEHSLGLVQLDESPILPCGFGLDGGLILTKEHTTDSGAGRDYWYGEEMDWQVGEPVNWHGTGQEDYGHWDETGWEEFFANLSGTEES